MNFAMLRRVCTFVAVFEPVDVRSGDVVVMVVWSSDSCDSRTRYFEKGIVDRRGRDERGFWEGTEIGGCSVCVCGCLCGWVGCVVEGVSVHGFEPGMMVFSYEGGKSVGMEVSI